MVIFDVDDEIDEIICWDLNEMWICKASECYDSTKYERYPSNSFSNYRGEFLLVFKNPKN